jgi:hypothetical protein
MLAFQALDLVIDWLSPTLSTRVRVCVRGGWNRSSAWVEAEATP